MLIWINTYSGLCIGFDSHPEFYGSVSKNVIIFGIDMSSSVHIDNKKKDILILGIVPTKGSVNTTLSAKGRYPSNFSNRTFS